MYALQSVRSDYHYPPIISSVRVREFRALESINSMSLRAAPVIVVGSTLIRSVIITTFFARLAYAEYVRLIHKIASWPTTPPTRQAFLAFLSRLMSNNIYILAAFALRIRIMRGLFS